jgi:2-keto-4-pentenoate hydratase/2-oxohepta-3-ene-1,7-dioic acid hydratase in catechol pathway
VRFASIVAGGREVGAVVDHNGSCVPLPALGGLPDTVLGLLNAGLDAELRETIARRVRKAAAVDRIEASAVRLAPLCRRPRKVIGIGLNYREHALDLDAQFPESPASFLKGDHTIVGPGDPIVIPAQSERTTAEAELGIVIGRTCWQVEEGEALGYVAGFVPILDQTAEDILALNPRFLTRAKNFPSFLSLGAHLVTTDEVLERFGDLGCIRVATQHNGASVRENVVANMAFGPAYLVSFHSKVMPLYPGDIISSGTPGAVVISPGDSVRCSIPGIGELTNPVQASPHPR